MQDSIDVRGLDKQDVSLIEALVKRLRERGRKRKDEEVEKELVFGTRRSSVIGKLTRKEIYEDL